MKDPPLLKKMHPFSCKHLKAIPKSIYISSDSIFVGLSTGLELY